MDANLKMDPAVLEVETETSEIAAIATGFKVVSSEGFASAGTTLTRIKAQLKKLEEARVRITGPLNESLREINRQAKESAQPLLDAEASIKRALVTYNEEQEQLRRAEQRRLDAEAQRKREADQARAREVERAAREKAEAERKAAEAERAAGNAAAAAKLEAKAETTLAKASEKVEALEERAAMMVAPVVTRAPPKVEGVSLREVWKFEITDPSKVTLAFLTPDTVKIGKIVASLRAGAAELVGPGVRIWSEKSVAAGARS